MTEATARVLEEMKQSHRQMHIECGASPAQAEDAWQRMIETPMPFDLPTFEELDSREGAPMTDVGWEKMEAEFEDEKQRYMADLRERYAKRNGSGAIE